MKRNGTTKAGTLRWRCKSPDCGVSLVRKNNADAAGLATFLKWLLKPLAQGEMSDSTSRTFRRKTAKYWAYWPLPHFRDESVSVLHVDGLHMGRKGVILIGCNEAGTPLGWYLARTEHAGAWSALLAQISTPLMVVTDGGSGFRKAMKDTWPQVRIQRCVVCQGFWTVWLCDLGHMCCLLFPCLCWGLASPRGVGTAPVVEDFDVLSDFMAGKVLIDEDVVVIHLVLQGREKRFSHSVIPADSDCSHGLVDPMFLAVLVHLFRTILAAVVTVEYDAFA